MQTLIEQLDRLSPADLDQIDGQTLADLCAALDSARTLVARHLDRLPPFHPTDADPRTCGSVSSYN